tara:strand:+ start:237 stop:509 length:273 start_codon:yes stop_codon:yes gene_type:complete
MIFKSSKKFFEIGPFATYRESIADFGSNMYLSYAILEIMEKQKKLEQLYLSALALDDEENMVLYKQELDMLRSTFNATLITTFGTIPSIS